jgi:hypothetical protein
MIMRLLLHLILSLAVSLSALFAQGPIGGIRIRLEADNPQIARAEGFNQAYQELNPKLVYFYLNKEGKITKGDTYPTKYDDQCKCWANYYLPYGLFEVIIHSTAFKRIQDSLVVNRPVYEYTARLRTDSVPYSYRDGQKYTYTRGQVAFAQTIIIFFKSEDLEKNLKFIEDAIPEAIVKEVNLNGVKGGKFIEPRLSYASNHYYVTLPVPNSVVSVGELLDEYKHGETRPFYAYMIGDVINSYIEKLLSLDEKNKDVEIELIEPTYFDGVPEDRFIDPDKTPKTEAYKQRIRRRLYEGG